MGQRKTDTHSNFACYVRNYTYRAISLSIPFGAIENQPRMSDAAYESLLENNRKRVSVVKKSQPEPASEATPARPAPEPPQDPAPKPVSTDTSSEAGKDW